MRYVCMALLAVVALAVPSIGQTPPPMPPPVPDAPAIILPDPPAPTPVPVPLPGTPTPLPSEWLYIVRSDAALIVLASPDGLLTVTSQAGPMTIRGKFVGGTGQTETKTFKEKHLYLVEAAATGRCELLIVPSGATAASQVVRRLIDANVGPLPPPVPPVPPTPPTPPTPPVPPVPPTPPAPIPEAGLRVLMVYETAESLTPTQQAIMQGQTVRDWLNAHCVKGPDGKTAEFRIWDKDINTAGASPLWQAAMKRPRTKLPWLLISNPGKGGYEGELPASVDEMIKLLNQYGS